MMATDLEGTISRKRKIEDEENEENEAKRKTIDEHQTTELMELADEILMEILKHLDGESLHKLSL